jgi:DNA polymerase III subunit beta
VVTLAATGTDVTVTTLSGSYKLSGGPAEDFPALPAVVVAEAACVAFEAAVLPAASTDEAKQILTGIHLRIAGGVMTQEATDGHRLCRALLRHRSARHGHRHPCTRPSVALMAMCY